MNQYITYIIILIVGVFIGHALGHMHVEHDMENMEGMDMSEMDDMDMSDMEGMEGMAMDENGNMIHNHPMLEVDQGLPIPAVGIEAIKDKKDGYNLHVMTDNFTFTPENVDQENVEGEGHAHIYVGDTKIARLYGNWFNLSAKHLEEGENRVWVTLNANDHSEWAINGAHIMAEVMVMKE